MKSPKPAFLKPLLVLLLFAAGVIVLAVSLRKTHGPTPSATGVSTSTAPVSATAGLGNAHATSRVGVAAPLSAADTAAALSAATGQDPPSGGNHAEPSTSGARTRRAMLDPVEMMKESLYLSDEQAKELEPVFKEERQKMTALRANTTLSRRDRTARINEMHQTADAKIKQVLTPEQAQKWQKMRSGQMEMDQPASAVPRFATPRFGTPDRAGTD
jgi:periplasmic protein CpxP/Spy